MSRNSKLISENLREEIAKELGVYDQVKNDGGSWASVSSRDCGNIVTKAIEIANRSVENKQFLNIGVWVNYVEFCDEFYVKLHKIYLQKQLYVL